jgi:hypothetical protein
VPGIVGSVVLSGVGTVVVGAFTADMKLKDPELPSGNSHDTVHVPFAGI